MKHRLITILLLFSLLLALAGCGKKETEPEISYDEEEQVVADKTDDLFALNYSAQSAMNPYTTDNIHNQRVAQLVYENLVQLDDSFQPQPGLFLSWASEDGIVWNFQPDLSRVFHDGHQLTADDIVYSINCAKESAIYTARLRSIVDVTAWEDGTVVVTLDRPNTQFPALLTIPVIDNNSLSYSYHSGTGPYFFGDEYNTLLRYNEHPNAKDLPIDVIVLREYAAMEDVINAFDNSDLDLVCNDPSGESDLSFSSVT